MIRRWESVSLVKQPALKGLVRFLEPKLLAHFYDGGLLVVFYEQIRLHQ